MSKIILMGEHTVVYGHKAIAIPFNKKVYVNIKKSKKAFKVKDSHLQYLVESTCNKLNKPLNLSINIINEIPRSKGLGSSASFAIEIIKAIYKYYNKKLDKQILYKIAKNYEDRIHLPSSGLDILTCINRQPIIFQKNKEIKKINFKLDLYLFILDTNQKGKTKKAIKIVRDNIEKDKILNNISIETDKFINLLLETKSKDRDLSIGDTFNKVNNYLDKLNIITNKAKEIIEICNNNKALGTKISGSGLGGIVISLVEKENIQNLKNVLESNNIKIIGIEKI